MASSSQNQTTANNTVSSGNSSSTTAPSWAPQLSDLTTAFNQANGALSNAQGFSATPGTNTNYSTNPLFNNGGALNTSGTNATNGALTGLAGYDPTTQNNTGSLIDAAKQYVSGQDIPAQVAQATQQAREQARDITMPGIEQHAAMTGNTNSSRTGIADGLVERGLAENGQNLSGALSSQAFKDGLTLASSNANANNTDKLGALSTEASAGTNAANAGAANEAGAVGVNGAQNTNNNQNFTNSVNNSYSPLADFMNLIGNRSWGSTSDASMNGVSNSNGTSNTTSTPSALSTISSLLGTAGSFLPF